MKDPEGTLTVAQHEILEAIWKLSNSGATVAEVWAEISKHREVSRTTILNQVDRLEKRGWLKRHAHEDGFRYVVTKRRDQVANGLAREFVDSFFGGSTSELVMSLLGSKKLTSAEVTALKALLESNLSKRKPH